MADRRMITKKVTDDDNFVNLSSSAQALYLHLSMNADDDGFCNQVTISMFKAHASVQDLQALLEKRYIYQFDNGVIVIKHWRMANALRKDRYTPTAFQDELSKLKLKENGAYTWLPDGCQLDAERLPQISIDKGSIDKNRLDQDRLEENRAGDITVPNGTVCRTKDVRRVVDAWNSLNLNQVVKITPTSNRGNMLRARINEYGVETVLKAIENIRSSGFLQGQNKNGWRITFDWFVKPNNFPKVLEKNYDDSNMSDKPNGKKNSNQFLDILNSMMVEEAMENE